MIEVVRYDTNHDTIRQSAENAKAATYSSSAISIGATLSSPSQTVTTHLPYAYRLHPRPPRSSCTTEASRGSVSESRAPSSSSLKRDSRRPAMPRARPRMREARAPASAPMQALTRTQTHPTAPTSYPHLTPLHPHIPHTPPHPHLTAPTSHRTHTPSHPHPTALAAATISGATTQVLNYTVSAPSPPCSRSFSPPYSRPAYSPPYSPP